MIHIEIHNAPPDMCFGIVEAIQAAFKKAPVREKVLIEQVATFKVMTLDGVRHHQPFLRAYSDVHWTGDAVADETGLPLYNVLTSHEEPRVRKGTGTGK